MQQLKYTDENKNKTHTHTERTHKLYKCADKRDETDMVWDYFYVCMCVWRLDRTNQSISMMTNVVVVPIRKETGDRYWVNI